MPTGRQGNLIVTSTKTVPEAEMRQKLIDEVKKQGKPYGLYFDDIQGGFTLTTRSLPQAFQVLPVIVYRVYADGRPDELVRGVDIVGTPLAALTRIVTTGDKQHVFNGVCGAESGSVPVSAVAPAMLFSEMEVQKRAHSHERPPILPPPGFETKTATCRERTREAGGEAMKMTRMNLRLRGICREARAGYGDIFRAAAMCAGARTHPTASATPQSRKPRQSPTRIRRQTATRLLEALLTELDSIEIAIEDGSGRSALLHRVSRERCRRLSAEAAFGAVRESQRVRYRVLRVVVRIGDYKQDSYYGIGMGETNILPLDNDPIALRHQIWLATDDAYKEAVRGVTEKQAALKQFSAEATAGGRLREGAGR